MILGIIGAFCLAVVHYVGGSTSAPCGSWSPLCRVSGGVSLLQSVHRPEGDETRPTRATPAVINNDGLNYVPTTVTCCLVTTSPLSPVLVRWSSGSRRTDGLPAWHAVAAGGGVLAGAVQDFMVLFISSRRNAHLSVR